MADPRVRPCDPALVYHVHMQTIIITGGHHNSALVVAKEFVKKGFNVIWLGHRYASRGDKNDSAEYKEVIGSGIEFHELRAGKIDSTPTFSEIGNIPLGFFRAWKYLMKFKPVALLSFGGYLGLTASLPAHLMGIPTYLHEQTLVAGKANTWTGKFARRIYLAWNEAARYFPYGKTQYVGLPLRESITGSKAKKLFGNDLPTILVMGGKQGSHTINTHIFAALPSLLLHYNLVHQTGSSSVTGDFETAVSKKDSLPPDLASHYLPMSYIGEGEIGSYLSSVDLVVGRSGAHTAYELGLLGRKCVLIPFMHTTGSEQHQQAKLLAKAGLATILPESELTTPKLLVSIKSALDSPTAAPLALPRDATTRLVDDLIANLS